MLRAANTRKAPGASASHAPGAPTFWEAGVRRVESAEFRRTFVGLTEPVVVMKYKRMIGTYFPGEPVLDYAGQDTTETSVNVLASVTALTPPESNVTVQETEPEKRRQAQSPALPTFQTFHPVPKPSPRKTGRQRS